MKRRLTAGPLLLALLLLLSVSTPTFAQGLLTEWEMREWIRRDLGPSGSESQVEEAYQRQAQEADAIRTYYVSLQRGDDDYEVALKEDRPGEWANTERLVQNEIMRRNAFYDRPGMKPTLRSRYNNPYCTSLSAKMVKQSKGYYCGPASALMAIHAMGKEVPGKNAAAKQDYLAGQFEITPKRGVGSYVFDVTHILDQYAGDVGYYAYTHRSGKTMTEEEFARICFESIDGGNPPVLHARTKYLSYYNGHNTGHYITVMGMDRKAGIIRLQDPHTKDKYNGVHRVPISEAYRTISAEEGRYLISGCQ